MGERREAELTDAGGTGSVCPVSCHLKQGRRKMVFRGLRHSAVSVTPLPFLTLPQSFPSSSAYHALRAPRQGCFRAWELRHVMELEELCSLLWLGLATPAR